jgi:glycosyltransferase involved in cell wall biosynthesis
LIQDGVENLFQKIFCVSDWQKNTFVKYFNCNPDAFETIGNPIDYSLYYGHTEREENRLVFSSIPYKGLEILPDLFNDIVVNTKKELQLHIFSSFELYGREQENEQYMEAYRKLNNTNGVFLHRPISMKSLAYEFMRSSLLIHPSTYHETFGRVFIESMASGCIPVTVNNGANKEIVGENGFVIDYPNIENVKCYEEVIEKTCELLNTDLYGKRVKIRQNMKKYNYINIARKVESYLGG